MKYNSPLMTQTRLFTALPHLHTVVVSLSLSLSLSLPELNFSLVITVPGGWWEVGGGRQGTGCNLTVLAAAPHPPVQSTDWFQQTRKYQARLERPMEEGGGRREVCVQ